MQREQLSPLAEGYQLKEYLIEKMLAAGGFGITYLAEEGPPLSRKVAVKEYLPPDLAMRGKDGNAVVPIRAEDEEDFAYGLKAFSKMARSLANIDHANIVKVLRVLRANSTAYMITEYQDRESLGSTLARRESQGLHGIEEVDLQELFSPLLEGVEAVHKAGILHRSIKPSSICLKWDGTPMLLGFGSARHREDATGTRLTATIAAGFSPIELYERDGKQGPWTDIYGLGAVLYRAIAGERPIDAPQRSEAIKAGRPDPLVPASRIGRNRFSESLLAMVDHALAVNPEDRPQTVDAWRGERSPVAPPETAADSEAAPKSAKAKPPAKAKAEKPAVTPPPSRQRPETEWREGNKRPAMVAVLAVVAALVAGGAGLLAYVDNLEKDRENQQLTAKLQAQEEAKRKSEEARIRAEEAKRKAEEEAQRRAEAEAEAKRRAEEEARLRAEAEAQAREEAKLRAEEEEKRKAEQEARRKAEAEAKQRAEEEAKRAAEAKAKREAAKKEAARQEAAKADPKDAALRDAKAGLAAARKGRYDDAIKLYTRAISSGGLSQKHLVVAHNNRGNLFLRKEQYDRAIKDFDEAVKLKPDYVKAYINRGNAYSDKRQFERAITNFTKAISLNPDEPTAYFNRCLTFERLGQRDRAIGDCRKALQLNPNDADARTALRQFGVTP